MACPDCEYGPADVCGQERPHWDPDFVSAVRGVCDCACHDRVVGYDGGDLGKYCVRCAQMVLGPVLVDSPILSEDCGSDECIECGERIGGG